MSTGVRHAPNLMGWAQRSQNFPHSIHAHAFDVKRPNSAGGEAYFYGTSYAPELMERAQRPIFEEPYLRLYCST